MPNIGKVKLDNNLILAPLHDVNSLPFRLLCKEFGAGLVTIPLIYPKRLFHNPNFIETSKAERPVSAQLIGNEPAEMAKAAMMLGSIADLIDLNFGCPDKKALENKSGAYLLSKPQLIGKIASKVASAVSCPVTAKIRSGLTKSKINAKEVCKTLEDSGIAAIAVHARSADQMYSGKSDWGLVGEIKRDSGVPIILSGDIASAADYVSVMKLTEADFAMIGRAAIGNPMIFRNCIEGTDIVKDVVSARSAFNRFLDISSQWQSRISFNEIRHHAAWFAKGIRQGRALKLRIVSANDMESLKNAWLFPS